MLRTVFAEKLNARSSLKFSESPVHWSLSGDNMSFSFTQALISETCPLTQPMGSDGRSQVTPQLADQTKNKNLNIAILCFQEYERESQLSQEQFSQDMCHTANQTFVRHASQEFSRQEQQESVSLLDNSQEIGWPVCYVRRTLPRPSDMQQESVSLLANSQELSWQEPPAPRTTLPRPPTWPRIATAGRPQNEVGKGNRQDCGSRGDPEGSKGPRAARWRLPSSSNKENIGQSIACGTICRKSQSGFPNCQQVCRGCWRRLFAF